MGEYETLLRQTLERLKRAVFSDDTSPRDLASLSRRMLDVCRELDRLENEATGGPRDIAEIPDAPLDPGDI